MELYIKTDKGYQPARAASVFEAASHYATIALSNSLIKIKSPNDVIPMVEHRLRGLQDEHFGMLLLDTKHRVLDWCEVSKGSLRESPVYSRTIIREVLEHNASAVILSHNHPSGDPTPSDADIKLTKHLIDTLQCIDVKVLDHIIVGHSSYSLAENKLM